jgi:hypothetical protein
MNIPDWVFVVIGVLFIIELITKFLGIDVGRMLF